MNLHKIQSDETDQLIRFLYWRFPNMYFFERHHDHIRYRRQNGADPWDRVYDIEGWRRTMNQAIANGTWAP